MSDISHTPLVQGQLLPTDRIPLGRPSDGHVDGKGVAYTASIQQIADAALAGIKPFAENIPRLLPPNPLVIAHWPLDDYGAKIPTDFTYTRTGISSAEVGAAVILGADGYAMFNNTGLISEVNQINSLAAGTDVDFSDAAWVKSQGGSVLPAVAANASIAPDFSMTADEVTFGATAIVGDMSIISQTFTAIDSTYAFSVYARGATGWASFNLSITNGTIAYTKNFLYPAGKAFRCSLVTPELTAGTWAVQIGHDARSFSGQPVVQSACTVALWGAQLNVNSSIGPIYPFAYTPAGGSGSGVSIASFNNPLNAALHKNWSVDVTATPLGDRPWDSLDQYIISVGAMNSANSWYIRAYLDGSIFFYVYDAAGVMRRASAIHGFLAGSTHRISVGNSDGALALYFDGVLASNTNSGTGTGVIAAHSAINTFAAGQNSSFSIRDLKVCRTANPTKISAVDRVLVLGDSITAGTCQVWTTDNIFQLHSWPLAYAMLSGKIVKNLAVGGATTGNIQTVWNAARGGKEKYLIVMCGTNDLISGVPVVTSMATLQTIYTQAISDGLVVIALSIPPLQGSGGWDSNKETNRVALNELIKVACTANPNTMKYIDVATALADSVTGSLKAEYNAGDNIHMLQSGAYRIANIIMQAGL